MSDKTAMEQEWHVMRSIKSRMYMIIAEDNTWITEHADKPTMNRIVADHNFALLKDEIVEVLEDYHSLTRVTRHGSESVLVDLLARIGKVE